MCEFNRVAVWAGYWLCTFMNFGWQKSLAVISRVNNYIYTLDNMERYSTHDVMYNNSNETLLYVARNILCISYLSQALLMKMKVFSLIVIQMPDILPPNVCRSSAIHSCFIVVYVLRTCVCGEHCGVYHLEAT